MGKRGGWNKNDRSELIRRLYWEEGKTLREIGAVLGISFQRVHQLMQSYGIPRRKAKIWFCKVCGQPILKRGRRVFCSPECRKRYHWVLLVCDYCGRVFWRRRAQFRASNPKRGYTGKRFYCSRECYRRAWRPPARKNQCS